jgi:hypothetical protein
VGGRTHQDQASDLHHYTSPDYTPPVTTTVDANNRRHDCRLGQLSTFNKSSNRSSGSLCCCWQKAPGYNWRALVEADIGRWKRVIGHTLGRKLS